MKEEANAMLYKNSPAKSEGSAGARRRGTAVSPDRFGGHSGSTRISRGSEGFTRHTAGACHAFVLP